MDDVIYHYCSVDTLVSIISNKCIRLSDLNKSNDYMEKKWMLGLIEEALNNEFKEENININLRENYWYSEGINNHISYLLDMMDYDANRPSYISCFSKHGDKLSQWRAYGNNGTGIALGFNLKSLSNAVSSANNLFLEKVLYKKGKQLESIQYMISLGINYMQELFEESAVRISNGFNEYFVEEFDAFCEVLYDYLMPLSCYIKNPAFIEEEEVRIFYSPLLSTEMSTLDIDKDFVKEKNINNFILKPIKFHSRNNQIVGYADLVFEKFISKGIISEIVIGPCSKVSEEDLFYLLVSNGYAADNVKMSKSVASYR